jgi:hypothetical protein
MASTKPVTAIVGRLKAKATQRKNEALTFSEAATEIANALNIRHEAATMTLYGLCATGNVRWLDDGLDIVDEDECTISSFAGKPALVIASDVRSFLTDWSPDPLPTKRETVISAMLAEGLNPPRNISWKKFCDQVRDKCNGWIGKRPALGFSQKQIQRIVNDLRSK